MNSQSSNSKSANTFSFYTSVDSLCTYIKIQCICSFTDFFLIFILIYNLHAVTKPATFSRSPSNNNGLAISSWNSYLSLEVTFSTSLSISSKLAASYTCKAVSYSACYFIRSYNCSTVLC